MRSSLAAQLAEIEGNNEAEDWEPTLQPHNHTPPVVAKLVNEIGADAVLAEATLAWVRKKKQQIQMAQLVALFGEEYVEQLKQRLIQEQ